MTRWFGFGVTGAAALMVAAAACHSGTSDGGISGGCDKLYTSFVARCGYPGYPASAISHMQGRWDEYCSSLLTLDGSNTTESELEQCASAYATVDCNSDITPAACDALQMGTRAGGAVCLNGTQCQSGSCSMSDSSESDAGAKTSCGTCDTLAAIGGSCTAGNAVCPANASCSSSEDGGAVCVVIPADAGATSATPGSMAGGSCADAAFCALGLACVQGTCVTPTFVQPGGACDATSMFCLTGNCSGLTFTPEPDGGTTTSNGTCPSVIADGQPCNPSDETQTCDAFATCLSTEPDGGATCQLTASNALCN